MAESSEIKDLTRLLTSLINVGKVLNRRLGKLTLFIIIIIIIYCSYITHSIIYAIIITGGSSGELSEVFVT